VSSGLWVLNISANNLTEIRPVSKASTRIHSIIFNCQNSNASQPLGPLCHSLSHAHTFCTPSKSCAPAAISMNEPRGKALNCGGLQLFETLQILWRPCISFSPPRGLQWCTCGTHFCGFFMSDDEYTLRVWQRWRGGLPTFAQRCWTMRL